MMVITLSWVFKINETDGGINNADGTEENSEGEYKRFEGDRNDKIARRPSVSPCCSITRTS